jgi:hypothetical protein
MKQITLSFAPEEYRELAKLMALGTGMTMGADDYPNRELADEVNLKICTNGYVQVPESGAFSMGGGSIGDMVEPEFVISDELHYECEALEEAYKKREFLEFLSCSMADRDFYEQYGEMEPEEMVNNREFLKFIREKQTEYRQEFMFNSIDNLRLTRK